MEAMTETPEEAAARYARLADAAEEKLKKAQARNRVAWRHAEALAVELERVVDDAQAALDRFRGGTTP